MPFTNFWYLNPEFCLTMSPVCLLYIIVLCVYIASNTQFVTSLFVTQNKCHFVIYKSFEKLSLNNFQVIIFERMAKNCFKVNILSNICWNLWFSMKKMIYFFPIISRKRVNRMVFKYFLLFSDTSIISATCWEEIIFINMLLL